MCGETSTIDDDFIQDAWFTTLPDYFEKSSFGALVMPRSANMIVTSHVSLACEGVTKAGQRWTANVTNSANLKAWADAADSLAASELGVPIANYFYRVYYLPSSIGSTSWGSVNCPQTFWGTVRVWSGLIAPPDCLFRLLTHELGHNLGLQHSQGYDFTGTVIQEYGDLSCPMGALLNAPPIHYNAAQSVRLGWTKPQAVLRANNTAMGRWQPYDVVGLADAQVSSLQILPGTWANQSGWRPTDKLYVSFRRATDTNGDRGLMDSFRNKVQVHQHKAWGSECVAPVLIATLDADDATDTIPGMWPTDRSGSAPPQQVSPLVAVRVVRIDPEAGVASVEVCRASQLSPEFGDQCSDGLDNDCDGQVDNCM